MDVGELAAARLAAWTAPPGVGFQSRLSDDDSPTGMRGTTVGLDIRAVDIFRDPAYQHVFQSEHRNRQIAESLSDRATQPGVEAFAAARQKRESPGEALLRETMLRATGAARELPFTQTLREEDSEAAEREIAAAHAAMMRQPVSAPAEDENDELIRTTALPEPIQRVVRKNVALRAAEDQQPPDPAPWWVWLIAVVIVVVGIGLVAGLAARPKLAGGSIIYTGGTHFVEAAGSIYDPRARRSEY